MKIVNNNDTNRKNYAIGDCKNKCVSVITGKNGKAYALYLYA